MKDVEKEKMKVVENLVEKEALKLVKEGFSITPLIGQRPIGEATNDPERIRFIWGRFPEANIGLEFGPKSNICGLQVSPLQEGLVSLKAQTRGHLSLPDGYVSLRGLIEECGSIEETPQAETLMGVRVYFFQYYPLLLKRIKFGLKYFISFLL